MNNNAKSIECLEKRIIILEELIKQIINESGKSIILKDMEIDNIRLDKACDVKFENCSIGNITSG